MLGAATGVGLGQGVERGFDAQHLWHCVDDKMITARSDLEALVREPMGDMHARKGVREGRVRAAATRKAGGVVVAAYHDGCHVVVPDGRQGSLHYPERAVMRRRVVEYVTEPNDEVGFLGESEGDGRLEGPLEVPLSLVYPALRRVGQVRTPQVGVPDCCDLHDDK